MIDNQSPVKVVPLDDTDAWSGLRHAYGTAEDIPELLQQAGVAVRAGSHPKEPWNTLWNSLYHQDAVFSASLAAVPHLLEIAQPVDSAECLEPLHLISAIVVEIEYEIEYGGSRPEASEDVVEAYEQALSRAPLTFLTALRRASTRPAAESLLAGIAALCGQGKLAHDLLASSERVECPNCDAVFPRYYDLDGEYSFADEQMGKT